MKNPFNRSAERERERERESKKPSDSAEKPSSLTNSPRGQDRRYPCPNPFSQLYMVPRAKLDLRFCPHHAPIERIADYERMGYKELTDFFNNHPKTRAIRKKFINGDFEGAGCHNGCECMAQFNMGGQSFAMNDYINPDKTYSLRVANLSMGPDCNIKCRYCLDFERFEVDFNTCKTEFGEFIVDFVHNGGNLIFTGGETFLPKWKFAEKLKRLVEIGDNKGSIDVFTNATLLTDELCDLILDAPFRRVGISMDTCRPELFNFIRRGSDFHKVLTNAETLLRKRDGRKQRLPNIDILSAMSRSTAPLLEETADFYIGKGFNLSLNVLFRAFFSPDFCESESLDLLSLDELDDVYKQLIRCEEKYGGKINSLSFKGQLENIIEKKSKGMHEQTILGGKSHAPRKHSVKILVGYHKKAALISDDIFIPIHLGRAVTGESSKDGKTTEEDLAWLQDNMIGDDTGKNISDRNRRLCEFTGLYWAWKNYDRLGSPDYIGFGQYRRHLIFGNSLNIKEQNGCVYVPKIGSDYMREIGADIKTIRGQIADNECLCARAYSHKLNVFEQFAELCEYPFLLNQDHWLLAIDAVRVKYPNYAASMDKYLASKQHHWFNMFVMKRELFFEFMEFASEIILPLDDSIDLSRQSITSRRGLGYISERLFGIFLTYKKDTSGIKTAQLPYTFIEDTNLPRRVSPIFGANSVNIVFASDNNYIPYLAVSVKSVIDNASMDRKYDICVLNDDASEQNKNMILSMQTENISIRFCPARHYIDQYGRDRFHLAYHYTIETYYRFFLPLMFGEYKKIIYLDCDSIALRDMAELFDIDLADNYLAAARDMCIIRDLYIQRKTEYYDYFHNTLRLENPFDSFQAGCMVFNLGKMREINFTDRCLDALKRIEKPKYSDQCVINSVCCGNVLFLPQKWNFLRRVMIEDPMWRETSPSPYAEDFAEAAASPYFIHYSSVRPWWGHNAVMDDVWWKYARETPFYEKIVYENLIGQINCSAHPTEMIKKNKNIAKIRRKILQYKILQLLTFGAVKAYKAKKEKYRAQLKN